jgi:hypothetical protein
MPILLREVRRFGLHLAMRESKNSGETLTLRGKAFRVLLLES